LPKPNQIFPNLSKFAQILPKFYSNFAQICLKIIC